MDMDIGKGVAEFIPGSPAIELQIAADCTMLLSEAEWKLYLDDKLSFLSLTYLPRLANFTWARFLPMSP